MSDVYQVLNAPLFLNNKFNGIVGDRILHLITMVLGPPKIEIGIRQAVPILIDKFCRDDPRWLVLLWKM